MGADASAYFRITKDDGTDANGGDYKDYSVESADKTKLLVVEGKLKDNTTAVSIHGVNEGSTYILVKKDGKTVASLPVTVLAKPVATTLDLSRTSVTVCSGAAVEEKVKVTVKDQYGDAMSGASEPVVTILGKPDASATANIVTTTGAITVTGGAFSQSEKSLGTYTFKVEVKKDNKTLAGTFYANVVNNKAAADSYELRLSETEIDTTVGKTGAGDNSKAITVTVARMANGGAMSLITSGAIYTLKNAKGDVLAYTGSAIGVATPGAVVSCAAVTKSKTDQDIAYVSNGSASSALTIRPYNVGVITGMSSNGDAAAKTGTGIQKNLAAGTYTVEAQIKGDDGKLVKVNNSFTIKDTQVSKVTFKLNSNKFVKDNTTTAISVKSGCAYETSSPYNKIEVRYDGLKQDNQMLLADNIKGVVVKNNNSTGTAGAYIRTMDVYVLVTGSTNVYVQVPLTINDQLAVCTPDGITE